MGLSLSNPAGSAEIGARSSATLTITTFGTNPVNPSGPVDTVPPQITGQQLVVGPVGSRPSCSRSASPQCRAGSGPGQLWLLPHLRGPRRQFGTSDTGFVTLAAAQYNPAAMTVTVTPVTPLPYDGFYRIVINALATTLLNRGIVDLSGNLLSGQGNGVAGSPFVSTFGAGPQLNYTDSLGKTVNLSLTGGGVIEVFRAASGDVQSVSLVGTVARKSVLSLRANKAGGNEHVPAPHSGRGGCALPLSNACQCLPIVARSADFVDTQGEARQSQTREVTFPRAGKSGAPDRQ